MRYFTCFLLSLWNLVCILYLQHLNLDQPHRGMDSHPGQCSSSRFWVHCYNLSRKLTKVQGLIKVTKSASGDLTHVRLCLALGHVSPAAAVFLAGSSEPHRRASGARIGKEVRSAFCLLFMLDSGISFRGGGICITKKFKNTLPIYRPQVQEHYSLNATCLQFSPPSFAQ